MQASGPVTFDMRLAPFSCVLGLVLAGCVQTDEQFVASFKTDTKRGCMQAAPSNPSLSPGKADAYCSCVSEDATKYFSSAELRLMSRPTHSADVERRKLALARACAVRIGN